MGRKIYAVSFFFFFFIGIFSASGMCNDCSIAMTQAPGLYWVSCPAVMKIIGGDLGYHRLADWRNMSFPNDTIMIIGNTLLYQHPCIPFIFVAYNKTDFANAPREYPRQINLYVDGVYQATTTPLPVRRMPSGTIIFYLYNLTYSDRGFHHIMFTFLNETGESFCPPYTMDALIGWNGFYQHIYPYLKKS